MFLHQFENRIQLRAIIAVIVLDLPSLVGEALILFLELAESFTVSKFVWVTHFAHECGIIWAKSSSLLRERLP